MNPRALTTSTLIALALAYGLFQLGSRLSFGGPNLSSTTQGQFAEQLVVKLNQGRAGQGIEPLTNDAGLQSWLDVRLEAFVDEDRKVDVKAMLDDLPLKLHTITNAAARTIEAKSLEDLVPQIDYWVEGYAEDTRIVAARLYKAKRGRVGCALVAAKSVPPFDLALLNEGITEFYNTCLHCERPHLGILKHVSLALSVSCPNCDRAYDLLAADMLGSYHRANDFLEGMRPPPEVGSDAESRLEEMVAIWSAAVRHCRYTVDLSGVEGAKDTWQKPSETYSFRNGDCEDSSLMLADWLGSRGFEARVAIGQAVGQGGHAWVVVMLHGEQYILESTLDEALQTPPTPEIVADQYQPDYLFDQQFIYFPESKSPKVFDYFDHGIWTALQYEKEFASNNEIDAELAGELANP